MDINPYEAPREPPDPPTADDGGSFAGMWARFTIQSPEPHDVEVYCSRWTGLEVYRIDGQVRLRTRSFGISATRRFDVGDIGNAGETERHVLEIHITSLPWWSGSATLDEQPVIGELFPGERRHVVIGFAIVATAVVGLLSYWAWRWPW